MKKLLQVKLLVSIVVLLLLFSLILVVIMVVCGYRIGEDYINEKVNQMRANTTVINNQLYAERYKNLLNKYLITKGYVSLERLVFYLQRSNNVLDTSTLDYEAWDNAYLENINEEEKQMIPIKKVCNTLKSNPTIPDFTIETGLNENGIIIEVIDLCTVNGEDITNNNDYDEMYYPLPYIFPLKEKFNVTSLVFEHRDIDLGLPEKEQEKVNFHSGWDLAVPIGTEFYSICDGTVKSIVNTQVEDIPFSQSNNKIGNYIYVHCDNNFLAMYYHIQYKSSPSEVSEGSRVKKGNVLGKTSTTGQSTGGHLHLELRDIDGGLLDAMAYINFIEYEEN